MPNPGGWAAVWSEGDTVATPSHSDFAGETVYTVTVTAAEDLVGSQLLDAPVAWSFTTELGWTHVYLPLVLTE